MAWPSDWHPSEKIGLPLRALHAPIAGYEEQLATGVDRFMETLRPGPIYARCNWFIAATGERRWLPDRPPREAFAHVTPENAGETLFVRSERQTLRRLPQTGAILFGIGLGRPIDGRYASWIQTLNAQPGPRMALDVPSGLNADTGQPLGTTFRATHTTTFIALKPGLLTNDGPDYCGEISVQRIDIDAPAWLPARGHAVAEADAGDMDQAGGHDEADGIGGGIGGQLRAAGPHAAAGPAAPADIRGTVEQESSLERPSRGFVDRLMFWRKPTNDGLQVDPQREAQPRVRPETPAVPTTEPEDEALEAEVEEGVSAAAGTIEDAPPPPRRWPRPPYPSWRGAACPWKWRAPTGHGPLL